MDNVLAIFATHAGEIVQVMDNHPVGAIILVILIWILTKKSSPSKT